MSKLFCPENAGWPVRFPLLLLFLGSMQFNVAIFAGATVVLALSLWLVRSLVTVPGPSYMRAMGPHR